MHIEFKLACKRVLIWVPGGAMLLLALSAPPARASQGQNGLRIRDIRIEGTEAFPVRTIRSLMLTRKSRFYSRRYFRARLLAEDVRQIERFYQDRGFFNARVDSHTVHRDTARHEVSVFLHITEGRQFRVANISFLGNRVFSDQELLQGISLRPNAHFDRKTLSNDNFKILSRYGAIGYIDTRVNTDLQTNTQTAEVMVDIRIEEGRQTVIDGIRVQGPEKTRAHVILREVSLEPGQPYDLRKALDSQRRIYKLGLFSNVRIQSDLSKGTAVSKRDIIINVTERKTGALTVGVGYGSFEKARTTLEVFQRNLAGTSRQLGTKMQASMKIQFVELQYTEPWIIGPQSRGDFVVFALNRQEVSFASFELGGRMTLGREFSRHTQVRLGYRYQNADLRNLALGLQQENRKVQTRGLRASLIFDNRDDLMNPSRGVFVSGQLEAAGLFLKGVDQFLKCIFTVRTYTRRGRIVLASGLRLGWIDRFGASLDVPVTERFFTGGLGSIRGFQEKSIGPVDTENAPLGGRFLAVLNPAEVRFPIYKRIGGVVFYDTGNSWYHVQNVKAQSLRHGVGAGLRITSPLGILRLDAGYNLAPRGEERDVVVHLALGQAF